MEQAQTRDIDTVYYEIIKSNINYDYYNSITLNYEDPYTLYVSSYFYDN